MGSGRTLPKSGELRYGLVVAVDIEGFSKMGILDQASAQAQLGVLMEQAAAGAGLSRSGWYVQPRGDGELAVLPTDTDVAWVVARYTQLLADGLRDLRSNALAQPHFRLRVAMHHGPLAGGELGPVGDAPIVACRLLDSSPVKQALAGNDSTDLVLVISRQLFTDIVLTGFHGLSPGRFRAIRAKIKGRTYWGYVCQGSPIGVTDTPHGDRDRDVLIVAD
ncbi:hypothetical protein [Actinocrispum sp. NPDC049592]|uniref:hypothetical protein n=1 Tax=Actinocrispum sp. NPDC049592 TaxID=3154835 RepID=UPI00344103FE